MPFSPEITLTKYLKYDARIGLDYFKKYNLIVNSTKREYILSNFKKSNFSKEDYGIRIYKVKGVYKIIEIKTYENFTIPIKLSLIHI